MECHKKALWRVPQGWDEKLYILEIKCLITQQQK